MKSSDAKASKCHLKCSSLMMILIKLVYLSFELKYTSLIKIIIKEENFKWHLEAFASELFICSLQNVLRLYSNLIMKQKLFLVFNIHIHNMYSVWQYDHVWFTTALF